MIAGGFYKAMLVPHKLVDAFVGFLPLERSHVEKCAQDSIKKKGLKYTVGTVKSIANQILYQDGFAVTGCREIAGLTNLEQEESEFDDLEGEDQKDEL